MPPVCYRPNPNMARPDNLGYCGEVPVEVLREAMRNTGLSLPDVARAMEWDLGRLRRALGLRLDRGKQRMAVRYETAVKFADAIGLDPVDLGV